MLIYLYEKVACRYKQYKNLSQQIQHVGRGFYHELRTICTAGILFFLGLIIHKEDATGAISA